MGLTALQPQSEPKTTPRSTEWCESGQQGPGKLLSRSTSLCVPLYVLPVVIGTKNIRLHRDIRRHDILNRTRIWKILDRLKVLLIKAPLYFCRFLKLGVSNAFVIDEAQLEFKMRTQTRLEKISTAISLFGMAMGFSVLGFLIVVNQHDGGASIPGGIFGILLGAAFLIAACLHLKRQIQGGFRLEEIPAEIVPEMRQATDAICGF